MCACCTLVLVLSFILVFSLPCSSFAFLACSCHSHVSLQCVSMCACKCEFECVHYSQNMLDSFLNAISAYVNKTTDVHSKCFSFVFSMKMNEKKNTLWVSLIFHQYMAKCMAEYSVPLERKREREEETYHTRARCLWLGISSFSFSR